MFEAQSREVSQMTLVLFLISSFRSLGELEDVCVFTGFRGSFGKETAQLLRSHSTPRPWMGWGRCWKHLCLLWLISSSNGLLSRGPVSKKYSKKKKKDCWLVLKGMLPSSVTPGSGCSTSRVLNGITEETKSLFKTTRHFGGLMAVAQAWYERNSHYMWQNKEPIPQKESTRLWYLHFKTGNWRKHWVVNVYN